MKPHKDEILVTGLGDAVGMAPAAEHLAGLENHKVEFCTYRHNKPSVDSFFIHHPEITLTYIPYLAKGEADNKLQSFIDNLNAQEAEHPELAEYDFYLRTYIRMGIDYAHRFSSRMLEVAADSVDQVPIPCDDYTFIHECPSRGFVIPRELMSGNIVFPERRPDRSILAFKNVMKAAKRLLFIDSCFFHVAEAFDLDPDTEKVLVRSARSYCPGIHDYATRHKWTEVW